MVVMAELPEETVTEAVLTITVAMLRVDDAAEVPDGPAEVDETAVVGIAGT